MRKHHTYCRKALTPSNTAAAQNRISDTKIGNHSLSPWATQPQGKLYNTRWDKPERVLTASHTQRGERICLRATEVENKVQWGW